MPVIPSGVEESLDIPETARDVSTSLDMTKKNFGTLEIYNDQADHSAAMNMAIDEALLEGITVPAVRFYRWQSPALSFGYFGRFADVAKYQDNRDLVRRWTGGGIVFHGEDLTYSLVIPTSDPAFAESSISIYEKVHRALCAALNETGQPAVIGGLLDPGRSGATVATRAGISGAGYSCFVNPVRADVLIDGSKIAGAAQRRTHRGLLQQGSIQGVDIGNGLAERFAHALSANCCERRVDEEILQLARTLAEKKYGTEGWLRKR
jgi:lipoate-protein ligase A